MEPAVIAVGPEVELQRLRLDQPVRRRIVDDQVCEIRLPGHRAQRREFRDRKPRQVERIGLRVGHTLQHRIVRAREAPRLLAKLCQAGLVHRRPIAPPHATRNPKRRAARRVLIAGRNLAALGFVLRQGIAQRLRFQCPLMRHRQFLPLKIRAPVPVGFRSPCHSLIYSPSPRPWGGTNGGARSVQ